MEVIIAGEVRRGIKGVKVCRDHSLDQISHEVVYKDYPLFCECKCSVTRRE